MRRILLCEFSSGETKLSHSGVALMIGVSVDELLEKWDPTSGSDSMPDEWKRRGAKRALHARNATGEAAATVNLAYLAARDWGARVDFDEKAGRMWAVLDDDAGR